MSHSSGRCLRGSHWPKSSRKENTRSLARARSSSRRAPPNAASKPCSAIASSSVVVCSRLREARGPVSSTTRPLSIDSCTLATIASGTRRSRNSTASGKLWPVSTCMTANGSGAAAHDLERDVLRPVDEVLHRLQPELDRHREVAHQLLEGRRPDALGEGVEDLALVVALGLVEADPALDGLRHAL